MLELSEDEKIERKLEKEKRISKEKKRLAALLKQVAPDKLKAVDSLVKNAAFITIALEDLQDDINLNGMVSTYQNGENQWGTKKSPEVETYNTMVKNHLAIIKQLVELVPESDTRKNDALLAFLQEK